MASSLAAGGCLIHQLKLLMLLLQEEVHQQALLFLDLVADVRGDIWDHPVHKDTQEHHKVLSKVRDKGRERRLGLGTLVYHCLPLPIRVTVSAVELVVACNSKGHRPGSRHLCVILAPLLTSG